MITFEIRLPEDDSLFPIAMPMVAATISDCSSQPTMMLELAFIMIWAVVPPSYAPPTIVLEPESSLSATPCEPQIWQAVKLQLLPALA